MSDWISDGTLAEEGGVNESSSDAHGQQMSPLRGRGGRSISPRTSPASTSPPAASVSRLDSGQRAAL